tara:strand:+ start:273 stop:458 length:186 start_codon:yes stop_codon:yes gene_type:complete
VQFELCFESLKVPAHIGVEAPGLHLIHAIILVTVSMVLIGYKAPEQLRAQLECRAAAAAGL